MTKRILLFIGLAIVSLLSLALIWALTRVPGEPRSAGAFLKDGSSATLESPAGVDSPGTGPLGRNQEVPLLKDLSPQDASNQLAEIFRLGDPLERKLRVLKMLRGMDAAGVRSLLETPWNDPTLSRRQRYELAEILFSRLGDLDSKLALSSMLDLLGGMPLGAEADLTGLIRKWGSAEPRMTLEVMSQRLDDSTLAIHFMGHVVYPNSHKDPQLAYELAKQLPQDQLDHRDYRNIFDQWSRLDPEAAAKAALTAPVSTEDNQRLFFIREFGTRWAQADRPAALEWVQSLDNDWDRGHILEGIVDAWGRENPQDAIAWVDQLPRDDLQTQRAIRKVAQGWRDLEGQYDAAVDWAMPRLTENFSRNKFVEEVTRHYYDQDPQRAADFVENLPAGPSRDAGIRQLIGPVTDADPSAGFEWAQALGNTAERQLHMEQAARQWLEVDPAAALAAIGQSDLPAEVKRELGGE